MNVDDTVKARLELLELAKKLGNVRQACAQTGFSRDSYYRFKSLYDTGGKAALENMGRNRPNLKNRVSADIANAILAVAAEHPEWGAASVVRHLSEKMRLAVSTVGVRGVWARHDLSTVDDRLSAIAEAMAVADGVEDAATTRSGGLDITELQNDHDTGIASDTPGSSASNILNSAFALFAERNYSQVTIKDISEATGLNPSLIYYYYGSKEGLFLKVVETAALKAHDTFRTIATELSDPRRTISLWIVNHSVQFELMQKLIKISIDYANTHNNNTDINRAIRRFYDIERSILKAAISQGVDSGEFKGVEVEKVATFISTFLDGVLIRSVMFAEFDFKEAILQLNDIVIGSILRRGPGETPFELGKSRQ